MSGISRNLRLLIVDAHADFAESLAILLEAVGYRVSIAADATSALRLATSAEFDAAFIAIALPDVDGYGLAQRLRALGRPPFLIALTGYGTPRDRARALAAGFDDHLLKPADVDQLEDVLARLLENHPG